MVALARLSIEMKRFELRQLQQFDIAFFLEFARQRFDHRFPSLDAAARQMPAGHIGVADEKDGVGGLVVDEATHAERHRTPEHEVDVEQPGPQAGPARLPEAVVIVVVHPANECWQIDAPRLATPRSFAEPSTRPIFLLLRMIFLEKSVNLSGPYARRIACSGSRIFPMSILVRFPM